MKTFFDCVLLIIAAFLCWPIILLLLGVLFALFMLLMGFVVVLSPIWIPVLCIMAITD